MSIHDDVAIRRARQQDLGRIVEMLGDDVLSAGRESLDDLAPYQRAFATIDADSRQLLMVADRNGEVIATLQLSLIPGLSRRGAFRAQIEGVRVADGERGKGLGTFMLDWAVDQAHRWGCQLIQLTSDNARVDAHRFYERFGFIASHQGFKMELPDAPILD